MTGHFHTGIDTIVFVGVAAILVRALWILASAKLAKMDGVIGTLGEAAGAIAK